MKERYKVDGKTVQVADKGLNCARNIYAAVVEAKDGYNLLVTSELDMDSLQVYRTYHNLWKIEESFHITKSYLDARPVYVQKKETIYGHFLICYLSLFLLRILEIKCFKNEINSYDLVNFMCDFRVVDKGDGTYINISQNQNVNEKIKKLIAFDLVKNKNNRLKILMYKVTIRSKTRRKLFSNKEYQPTAARTFR